jgi:hypothetical protein
MNSNFKTFGLFVAAVTIIFGSQVYAAKKNIGWNKFYRQTATQPRALKKHDLHKFKMADKLNMIKQQSRWNRVATTANRLAEDMRNRRTKDAILKDLEPKNLLALQKKVATRHYKKILAGKQKKVAEAKKALEDFDKHPEKKTTGWGGLRRAGIKRVTLTTRLAQQRKEVADFKKQKTAFINARLLAAKARGLWLFGWRAELKGIKTKLIKKLAKVTKLREKYDKEVNKLFKIYEADTAK